MHHPTDPPAPAAPPASSAPPAPLAPSAPPALPAAAPEPAAGARLWWVWYGPRAPGTAAHFARHVEELFAREAIVGAVGVEATGPGAARAWCTVPAASEAAVVRALRPHGVERLDAGASEAT